MTPGPARCQGRGHYDSGAVVTMTLGPGPPERRGQEHYDSRARVMNLGTRVIVMTPAPRSFMSPGLWSSCLAASLVFLCMLLRFLMSGWYYKPGKHQKMQATSAVERTVNFLEVSLWFPSVFERSSYVLYFLCVYMFFSCSSFVLEHFLCFYICFYDFQVFL